MQLLRQGDAKVVQEVFANEAADETRGAGETQPARERNSSWFGTAEGPAEPGFGTVEAKEQRGRWSVN